MNKLSQTGYFSQYIKVRTQFQGFHRYPGAGAIDERIAFLENEHRHLFKVEVKMSVNHADREVEFFLCKWDIEDFIKKQGDRLNHVSCEMIAEYILDFLKGMPKYGPGRYYEITVSEDGESDGIVEWIPYGTAN